MPDLSTNWSEVGAADVRTAMGECDSLGSREFNARYRFGRAHDATLWQGGVEYDARALMGLAYLRSTGQTVPVEEFDNGGEDGAVNRLKELGFDVIIDEKLTPAPRKRRAPAEPRTPRPKASRPAAAAHPPAPKRIVVKPRPTEASMPEAKICPTCFMALPATGICDNCE